MSHVAKSFSNLPTCPMATRLIFHPWLTFNPFCPGRQNKAADIASSSLPAPHPLPPLYTLVGWWSEQKPRAAVGNRDTTQKAQLQALFCTLHHQSEVDHSLSMMGHEHLQAHDGKRLTYSVPTFLMSFLLDAPCRMGSTVPLQKMSQSEHQGPVNGALFGDGGLCRLPHYDEIIRTGFNLI